MPSKLWESSQWLKNNVQTTERGDYIDLEWLQLKVINCPLSPFLSPFLFLILSLPHFIVLLLLAFFRHIFPPVRLYRLFWSRLTDSTISREVPRHYEHNFQQSFTSRTRGNYISGELKIKTLIWNLWKIVKFVWNLIKVGSFKSLNLQMKFDKKVGKALLRKSFQAFEFKTSFKEESLHF